MMTLTYCLQAQVEINFDFFKYIFYFTFILLLALSRYKNVDIIFCSLWSTLLTWVLAFHVEVLIMLLVLYIRLDIFISCLLALKEVDLT